MSDPRINDRRGQEKPDREKFHVYPTCRTCKYFEHFVSAQGEPTQETVCVIHPPMLHPQIKGVDEQGRTIWDAFASWPPVGPAQRCGQHVSKEAN